MRWHAALLMVAGASAAGTMVASATPPGSVDQAVILADAMPPTLSAFGFFANAPEQVPGKGVTAYRLNSPLWSDGAEKLRFVYIPPGKQAHADGGGLLDLPVGSALIKTFAFRKDGKRKLIETRVLLHRASGWAAFPYIWNAGQTEAKLAIAGGHADVTTPAGVDIDYRIPNKNQCKECHGLSGKVTPIGPKARNLPRGWLEQMVAAGHLDRVPQGADILPMWENRAEVPARLAARAYLDANCAHCHQPNATASNSGLDLRWEQDDPEKYGVMKHPVAAGRGSGDLLYDIVPGDPDHSIIVHRMASSEPGVAMPELGKASVDGDGVAEVRKWIAEMPK
ncbi:hypothetical protein GRI58_10200 [Porphyrobacter algicida]|uniref:Cytochrome c domain-containing protein n=1 Tax=Qipengyuania algicida TaxID=1836209 RepID=A0A845AF83_9SPHN|nr:SO2930 family diheme c-type cytochrome [Qipengyuania algicida]MXP29192.1 hypothetical protein [Qipengyuania algicida]